MAISRNSYAAFSQSLYSGVVLNPQTDSSGVTVTSGSNIVADTSAIASYAGQPVTGTGIPTGSYVGTVVVSTSFTLVNASGGPVNATAAGTSVTVGSVTTPAVGVPYVAKAGAFFLNDVYSAVVGGTSPTFLATLQVSIDGGTTWTSSTAIVEGSATSGAGTKTTAGTLTAGALATSLPPSTSGTPLVRISITFAGSAAAKAVTLNSTLAVQNV